MIFSLCIQKCIAKEAGIKPIDSSIRQLSIHVSHNSLLNVRLLLDGVN